MTSRNANWNFDNSYARLPEIFFVRQDPVPVRAPELVVLNEPLARELGLDPEALRGEAGASIFAGNSLPPGAEPIAQAYAGHQFGHLNMLGDGRALLLGEQLTPAGERFDIQLKGSGPTPFSRRGDGRAALGPMLREYIISEAMAALGIPTTRSLAVAATGEPVFREAPLPGAVLTRVAASHIRVGTFVLAAGVENGSGLLRRLADYSIQRHYPRLASGPEPYAAFLEAVADAQAELIARWMGVGFIHGVMNTDNVAISGETIDYGPCAFMDAYSPATVFSSIDRQGRYAFGNQPRIGAWNLARFAEALLPLLDENEERAIEKARVTVESFGARFERYWLSQMRRKLGLIREEEGDATLVNGLLERMEAAGADYTNTFRALSEGASPPEPLIRDEAFRRWRAEWEARLARQPDAKENALRRMRESNPAVIPRNHRVEEALAAAVERSDLTATAKLLAVLAKPFEGTAEQAEFREPAPRDGAYRTFCGT